MTTTQYKNYLLDLEIAKDKKERDIKEFNKLNKNYEDE